RRPVGLLARRRGRLDAAPADRRRGGRGGDAPQGAGGAAPDGASGRGVAGPARAAGAGAPLAPAGPRGRGDRASARGTLVPGHGTALRRTVRRPLLRNRVRGEVPLSLDGGGRAGAAARVAGALPALVTSGRAAWPRGVAGLALGGRASAPLQ